MMRIADNRDDRLVPRSGKRGRQRWVMIAKTALALALLAALLLWEDNGRKLITILAGFRTEYILALMLLALALVAVSSIKWSLFVRKGVQVSQLRLFGLYLIGYFVNNFLPSSVGGDLARIYLLGRQVGSHSASAASVFLERATGVVGLTILASLFALFHREMLGNPMIALPLAGALAACTLAITLFYRPSLMAWTARATAALPGAGRSAARLERLIQDITGFRHRHRLLLTSLLYSFAFHLLAGLNVYVACLSIGFEPALLDILVITPVVLLLTMLPVSPNNIGWWEWCFSVLLLGAGATAAEGLAVALTLRATTLCASLVGGLLLLQERFGRAAP